MGWRDAHGTWFHFPFPIWWLTTIFLLRGFDSLFWPLQAPGLCVVHRHICRQNTLNLGRKEEKKETALMLCEVIVHKTFESTRNLFYHTVVELGAGLLLSAETTAVFCHTQSGLSHYVTEAVGQHKKDLCAHMHIHGMCVEVEYSLWKVSLLVPCGVQGSDSGPPA